MDPRSDEDDDDEDDDQYRNPQAGNATVFLLLPWQLISKNKTEELEEEEKTEEEEEEEDKQKQEGEDVHIMPLGAETDELRNQSDATISLPRTFLQTVAVQEDDLVRRSLYLELDEERNAAESAANEAISMIVKLQVEKASLQMEASHYRRMLEAKSCYDEETISQLQDIISRQEEDNQALVREVKIYKHILLSHSDKDMEKELDQGGCSLLKDKFESIETFDDKRLPAYESYVSVRDNVVSAECDLMSTYLEGYGFESISEAEHRESPILASDDEAKTKHVVSFKMASPMSNTFAQFNDSTYGMEDIVLGRQEDISTRYAEVNSHSMCRNDNSKCLSNRDLNLDRFQDIDINHWKSQCNKYLEEIESKIYRHHRTKGKANSHPFLDMWNERTTDLELKLAICKSQLQALEGVRESMTENVNAMHSMEKPDMVLAMTADLLQECSSFASLGSNTLDMLNKLFECLEGLVKIVEKEEPAETLLTHRSVITTQEGEEELQDEISDVSLGNEGEGPEKLSKVPDNSSSEVIDSGFAYLWSICFQWMNDERCRADTAFSGWDH